MSLFVNGVAVGYNDGAGAPTMVGVGGTMFTFVKAGSTYGLNNYAGGQASSIVYWAEFY